LLRNHRPHEKQSRHTTTFNQSLDKAPWTCTTHDSCNRKPHQLSTKPSTTSQKLSQCISGWRVCPPHRLNQSLQQWLWQNKVTMLTGSAWLQFLGTHHSCHGSMTLAKNSCSCSPVTSSRCLRWPLPAKCSDFNNHHTNNVTLHTKSAWSLVVGAQL